MLGEEKKGPFGIPRYIWVQLFFLALGYAFYSANRLSFAIGLKSISKQLALTVVQVGWLATIFTLGQALIDIPAGYLADRLGRKRMLLLAMFGIGVTTMAVTTATTFYGAAIWRFAFGATEGIWNIVMYSVAGSIFPASRAMINGLMMSFYSIGAYIGPTYYGWTLDVNPGDWKTGLLTMGATTFAFGFVLMKFLRAKDTDASKDIKTMHLSEAIKNIGTNRGVWLGITLSVLNIIPYWGFASMGPYLFATYKGFSNALAGEFFGIIYGIGGLSSVVLGHFADKYGRKPVILLLAALNVTCAYLIFHVISSSNIMLLYLVGGMLGVGLHALYILGYTVGQDAVSTGQIGLATGLIGACMYFTSFLSGPGTGYLTKQFGHLIALDVIVIGFQTAIIILALVMNETQKKISSDTSAIAVTK
ncbi:MAG: MFS transporter [Negativicutes bacterium]|nr:MFS transporter [Negativicutes bacterium]